MKFFNIPSALLCVSLFLSCTHEIPFNIKDSEPKLIINALIESNIDNNIIHIALTGKYNTDSVQNATVNIYINEEHKEQITQHVAWDSESSVGYPQYNTFLRDKQYKVSSRFQPGDKVKIEVFANNNTYHAWVEDIIPHPIEIEHIDTMTYGKNYQSYIRLKTTFTDNPNEKNFYRIEAIEKIYNYYMDENGNHIPFTYETYLFLDTREDIVLNDGKISTDDEIFPTTENRYTVFNDTRLNGIYTMTTHLSAPMFFINDTIQHLPHAELTIRLLSITEMQYHYLKALNIRLSDNYDEYLSTPIVFPSNIEGGVGIVGFTSGTQITINIPYIVLDPF